MGTYDSGVLDSTQIETDLSTIIEELQKLTADKDSLDVSFTNATFGTEMAQNVSFSGTPDIVHDGTDTTAWTASASQGTWTFNSTDHARNAKITVVDYTGLSTDTVTIVISGISTTLTEGTDWTAATSNNATATSLASALDGVSGISASATAAVITILTDSNKDITSLTTSDAVNLTVSARSIDGTSATADQDAFLLTRSSSIDISNYTALTGSIFIEGWSPTGVKDIQVQARLAGVNQGNAVSLADFVSRFTLNKWLDYAIDKSVFGLTTESIDELLFTKFDTGDGVAPTAYHDKIQWEETGSTITYTVDPLDAMGAGTEADLVNLLYFIEGPLNSTLANGNVPILPTDSFVGIPELTTGVVFQFTRGGSPLFALTFKTIKDVFNTATSTIDDIGTNEDGTSTWVTVKVTFDPVLPFNDSTTDQLRIIINDNLSGLTSFGVKARYIFDS